jgi:hypothetical protein
MNPKIAEVIYNKNNFENEIFEVFKAKFFGKYEIKKHKEILKSSEKRKKLLIK